MTLALQLARTWPPLERWLDPGVDDRLIATAVQLLEDDAAAVERARHG